MRYVLGFAFNPDLSRILLIRKAKPEWQRGLLNGVGGKIEDREIEEDAMAREFREETGIETLPSEWLDVLSFGRDIGSPSCQQEGEEEEVGVYRVDDILYAKALPMIMNIPWLVDEARKRLTNAQI